MYPTEQEVQETMILFIVHLQMCNFSHLIQDMLSGQQSKTSVRVTSSPAATLAVLWGVPDTQAFVGKLFRYQIPDNAFTGDIDSFRVTRTSMMKQLK